MDLLIIDHHRRIRFTFDDENKISERGGKSTGILYYERLTLLGDEEGVIAIHIIRELVSCRGDEFKLKRVPNLRVINILIVPLSIGLPKHIIEVADVELYFGDGLIININGGDFKSNPLFFRLGITSDHPDEAKQ